MTTRTCIKAVIADDDPAARTHLRQLLQDQPLVDIKGEAASVAEATALCRKVRPDVVFLDADFPESDADPFSLFHDLDPLPAIVFVTAHQHFAARAFEMGSLDYIVKPVRPDRLQRSLSRLRGHSVSPTVRKAAASPPRDIPVAIPLEHRKICMVPAQSILHIRADSNYSHVHLEDGRELYVYRTLSQWQAVLPEYFLRLDRSIIVNSRRVSKIHVHPLEQASLHLSGSDQPTFLGRTALRRFRRVLSNFRQVSRASR